MQTLNKGEVNNKLPRVSGPGHSVQFFIFHLQNVQKQETRLC